MLDNFRSDYSDPIIKIYDNFQEIIFNDPKQGDYSLNVQGFNEFTDDADKFLQDTWDSAMGEGS